MSTPRPQGLAPKAGPPPKPPEAPILHRDDEPPVCELIRADLLKALGPVAFARYANAVRFDPVADPPSGRTAIRINDDKSPVLKLYDGERMPIVQRIARKHGFEQIW